MLGLPAARPAPGFSFAAGARPAAPAPLPAAPALPPDLLLERGLTCAAIDAPRLAIAALREATARDPTLTEAWSALSRQLLLEGDTAGAEAAAQRAASAPRPPAHRAKPPSPGKLAQAERKLRDTAEAAPQPANWLRNHLIAEPTDAAALRLLAERWRAEREPEAIERVLQRALELAPDYTAARHDYAGILLAQGKMVQALPHIDRLIAQDPSSALLHRLRAEVLSSIGCDEEALAVFGRLSSRAGQRDPQFWLAYARALLDAGRREDSQRAYRTCLELAPACGEAYWGIANLKAGALTPADAAAIRSLLPDPSLAPGSRACLHAAMGYLLEQDGDFAGSFAQYAAAARLQKSQIAGTPRDYNADAHSARVQRMQAVCGAALFAAAPSAAPAAPTPIFIVGMPRSGSTLLEQILASHSAVEGTQELPALALIARELDISRRTVTPSAYPEILQSLTASDLTELGARYLDYTAPFRRTDRPYFVDKLLGNWLNIGLIQLILPNARIIDARRHPLATCISSFKQMLIGGGNYAFDLTDLARRTRDYHELLEHFDTVLPGRVHRVEYETLVQDTEAEIRRLLAYCGLPFEPSCLSFWQTGRAIRTPSAEQVRRPIFRDGLDQWRNFEPWLGPAKAVLGL